MTLTLNRRSGGLLAGTAVAAIQVAVFYFTPLLNRIYDGWPRAWLVLSVAILATLFRGRPAGIVALAVGVAVIWWDATTFIPMHPALEFFTAVGLTQILVIHRMQVAQRELIQRQRALEAERNRANYLHEVAEQANAAKDQLLATLSHELRTPLNVILGYSRMMRGGMASPESVRKTSQIIERNAVAQMRIVEDLLDVQRIIKAGFAIEYEKFDLRALTSSVMESLNPLAVEKRLHWAGRVDPLTVEADRARIQQVLWNLLSNAIKFTPPGGCIGVAAVRENGEVVVTVEDSGVGIPPDFLPHIFEPFRQLDMSTTRRHGGLGIGLTLVKSIIEAHGGSVAAHSEGSGAQFIVRFPITAAKGKREEVA
ncbi:MAG TPA: HAMP domain-containing sensor histidine kinase [Vicinamibacterales bacterium]|nr:HAMP domain-containing sensor histidine kinase [Vicinamibacterales bacterium]